MKRRLIPIAAATACLLGLAACAGEPEQHPTGAPEFDAATVEALGGEENAHYLTGLYEEALGADQTVITVYGITATSSASLYAAFSERFPGITVEHVTIFGAELQNRIASEQATGQFVADNVSVSGTDAVFLTEEGYIAEQEPVLAEQLDDAYMPAGNTLFGGNTYLYTLSYNTDLVSEDEVPRNFEDLLDPKWAGQFGMLDPNLGPSGLLYPAIAHDKIDESYLEDLAENDPVFFPSERDVFTAVSTGQIALGIGNYIRGEAFLETDNLPVGFVADFEEGVSDGVFYRGTVVNAPNAIASDLLVGWWLTPEAQALIAAQGQPGLMPGAPPVPGQPPLSEITVNAGPPFKEYAEYVQEGLDIFKSAFN